MNLRLKLSSLVNKKVPALSLLLVATAGMVAGALAATMVISPSTTYTGVAGSYRTSTGSFTVTDQGLAVVSNAATSNVTTSVTFGATGTDKVLVNTLVAGRWMYVLEFTTTLTDSTSHTVTTTIRSDGGPLGSTILINAQTSTLVAPAASSTAKITIYYDLGVTTITAPLTAYVTVS